jgi:sulfoacetaldehyde dehydrogenase
MTDVVSAEKELIAGLVSRARAAQKIAESYTQEQVDTLAAAIVYALSRPDVAQELAEMAMEETDMGDIPSKYAKLAMKMPAVFYDIKDHRTVGVIATDSIMGVTILAKPIGVIAALIPSTNPEATPVFKGVLGIRARNAVICAPHPASKKTSIAVVEKMRAILKKHGAPEDLIICIEKPSKGLAAELMAQCDLTMATGSGDMVRAAYSSGKPAYGVGAGNAPIIVDETVNLAETAEKIRIGKTGDGASGCSAENSLIVQKGIYAKLMEELKKQGAYLATPEEKARLQAVMWEDGHLSRKIVAKPAKVIADLAGIAVPENTKFIVVEETGIGKDYPFSGEKLSLVLTVYSYDDFQEAIDKVNAITSYSGRGHSCGIHSHDKDRILRLALSTKTSRVIVRQSHGASNSGAWHNGLANTFSLGCGTWGGNIVSENVTQKHYYNTTRIAEPIDRKPKSDEEIFGKWLSVIAK